MSEEHKADPAAAAAASSAQAAPASTGRKKAVRAVLGVAVVAGIAYAAYDHVIEGRFEHTDNAYVQANVVQITPQVAGTVLAIQADDTDMVKAGQLLVKLDEADAKVALEQAEAQLAQTVREVRTLFANNAGLRSQIQLRQAEVQRAQNEVKRAQDDVDRRKPLYAAGAIGKEEFDHVTAQLTSAQSAMAAAQSALAVAQDQLQSNQSLTEGTSVQQHPNVVRAAARVRETYLALKRAALVAPVDGYVAKRSVQVGQRVQAGAPLMTVVSLDQPWVDANFKESQLQRLRIGQPATLKADVYGQEVVYHGKVIGMGAGTGAAFSLLPAQNATGNWIKIVQRVPVRVALDAAEVKTHPLRVGLSMEVKVDVRDQGGAMLAVSPRAKPVAQTAVFDDIQHDADARVARIIASNLGAPLAHAPVSTERKGA
ncbi:MAG: HlyD family efflux transporter periplasmic adaptor subunit [Aquabacterium sp.]